MRFCKKLGWCDDLVESSIMRLCLKWDWCNEVVDWVSCVCVWNKDDVMILLNNCHAFVYEVRMLCWCCWISVIRLCMKWGWCDEVDEWVSCVWLWSDDDMMMFLTEYLVFAYEVRLIWWCCWLSVMCLCIDWGWCDDIVEWVSCVCVWSEDDAMRLMSECHVFVYEVMMIWWWCWVCVMCLCMK